VSKHYRSKSTVTLVVWLLRHAGATTQYATSWSLTLSPDVQILKTERQNCLIIPRAGVLYQLSFIGGRKSLQIRADKKNEGLL